MITVRYVKCLQRPKKDNYGKQNEGRTNAMDASKPPVLSTSTIDNTVNNFVCYDLLAAYQMRKLARSEL